MSLPLIDSKDDAAPVPRPYVGRLSRWGVYIGTRTAVLAAGLAAAALAHAQGTGVVEGRVFNATTGNYLNNARVSASPSGIETFTNSFGEYRLADLPAGTVVLRVSYTGLLPQTASVAVAASQRVTRDFTLTRAAEGPAADEAIVLDAFVIDATREMSGRDLAINEQRFAPNLKNVVSADEFGDMAEGNVGEFLKYLPGVTIDYVGADPRNISVRGLPPMATPVLVDGAVMASAASSGASRVFELEQVSINNVSRIEVTKSPTPDLPASAVGGAVNMISRSAFERAKPQFNYRAYLNWNTDERFLRRTGVGPSRESNIHTNPSFDFSYLRPVTKNFGFTLTGSYSDQYAPDYRAQPVWTPGQTGSALAPTENPFLRNYTIFYGPKVTQRTSAGTTVDWRISERNVITLGAQWNYYDAFFSNKSANVNTLGSISNRAPVAWGPTFTQGQPGGGSISFGSSSRRKSGTTGHLSLKLVHDGPVWKFDAGAAYSDASNHYRDGDKGYVNTFSMSLTNVTLRLDNIDGRIGVPRTITATTAAGQPVDWTRIAPYRLNNIVFNQIDSRNLMTSARVNARRDFNLPIVSSPLAVRTGLDTRRMDRDIRDHLRTRYNFVGPDRVAGASSTDDFAGLYDLAHTAFHQSGKPGFGEPWIEYPNPYKLYDLFAAHPDYFVEDLVFRIQNEAADSRKLTEVVSAAYLRTDWRFFNNRLWVVAGARYERTGTSGYGLKNDPTALYQKDAGGNLIRGANGLPVRIPGLDPVSAARLQYTDRGAHAKRNYDGLFPSTNIVVNLSERLLLRSSYAKTITRPELDRIIPGMTVTDPNTANTSNLLISVNNTGLKPWTADNFDLGLEYYFGQSGGNLLSIGGFRKDIKDFFTSRRVEATPELLESFGLDQSYLSYDVEYRANAGEAKVTGLEFSYRQALTFLPHWARGMDVFYNVNSQRVQGRSISNFNNFIRRNDNYGLTLSRPKFTVRLKVNDRGRQRLASVAGANLPPGTYRYQAPRRMLDIDVEYRLRPGLSVFVAGRNVTDEPSTHQETYGPGTPEYARTVQYWKHAVNYVVGIKGRF
jgi:iron complex outermembrane recepter protein